MPSSSDTEQSVTNENDTTRNAPLQEWSTRRDIAFGPSSNVRLQENSTRQVRVIKEVHGEMYRNAVQRARLRVQDCVSNRQDLFVGHAWYETSHSLFIVRQFDPHGDLRNYMRSGDVSSNAAEIVRQVSTGLAILHEKMLFHGDLQPSNIYISSLLPFRIQLANFGAMKPVDNPESNGYLAPERLGIVDMSGEGPVDMWAVGCLIFELLTSILPWSSPVGYQFPLLMLQSYCRKLIPLPIHHFLLKPGLDYDSLFRLVEGLLRCDPGSRLSAMGALQSTWLASAGTNDEVVDWIAADDGEDSAVAGDLIAADDPNELGEDTEMISADDNDDVDEAEDSIQANDTDQLDEGMDVIPAGNIEESDEAQKLIPADDGPSADPVPDVPDSLERGDDRTRPAELLSSRNNTEAPAAPVSIGGDISDRDESGRTALHQAASCGNTELVERLLAAGARTEVSKIDGTTTLLVAAWNGHTATIDFLLQSGNSRIDERDSENGTSLLYAAYNGHNAALELLLRRGASIADTDKSGSTAPMKAAFNGHADTLAALHGHGADLRRRNRDGDTALSLAALQGHLDSVQFLLDQGVDIDQRSFDGYTPILKAAANGHTEVALLLLSRGADWEREVKEGDIISLAEGNEHYETAEELRTHLRTMEIERRQQRRGQRSSRRLAGQ